MSPNNQPEPNPSFARSMELFERARRVIPGGIYGHANPSLVGPGNSPYYATKASGCRYWDADGNEFIDYMCGYGPIVLGYQNREVEEAAEKQRHDGDCLNHPGPVMVDLAERLVSLVDFADWCVFGKNGSDMTTWALQVARQHTQRKKILMAEGAYHGIDPWCVPGHGGIIEEDRAHIHTFKWNDPQSLLDLAQIHADDIAAIITTPYHHPAFADSELPNNDFLAAIKDVRERHGCLWILDDIRAGFRLHLGGSHCYFGFTPDLACYSKAIANGYPLAACVGSENLKISSTKVFLTGSFWNGTVAMAAALKTIEILERDDGISRMEEMGTRLRNGLSQSAERHGLSITCSGPPAIPFLTFSNESNFFRSQHFSTECIKRGAFIHPHHNWFLSTAHTEADIDQTIAIADTAFESVKTRFED